MEQRGRNGWQTFGPPRAQKRLELAQNGKEGVDGSSPSEGFGISPAQRRFLLPLLTAERCFDVEAASTRLHGSASSALVGSGTARRLASVFGSLSSPFVNE